MNKFTINKILQFKFHSIETIIHVITIIMISKFREILTRWRQFEFKYKNMTNKFENCLWILWKWGLQIYSDCVPKVYAYY